MKKNILKLVLALVFILPTAEVCYGREFFQDFMEGLERDLEAGSVAGMGVMSMQQPYEGKDDEVYAVPLIVAEYKQFFIDADIFGYYFQPKEEPLRVALIASPRFQGYEDDDASLLNGMEDRDWAFDGGLRLSWPSELFDVNLEAVADLSGRHKGQELRAIFSKTLLEGFLTPKVGIKWQSQDLLDYYYGVKSSEATAGRPEYEPDSGLQYFAGLTLAVPLAEKWALVGDIQSYFLADEVKDSPIVNEDTLMRYVAGVVYRF